MKKIYAIHAADPGFDPALHAEGVKRYEIDGQFVDALGGKPTAAEIAAVMNPPPQVVDMAQARLALIAADLYHPVQDALAAMQGKEGDMARVEWEYRTTVRRDSPLLVSLASALKLDDAKLDALFIAASKL